MATKKELIEQTKLAYDFIQKLFLETSYLIKEVESNLSEEPEEFVIGKPGGYAVTSRTSSGLEANYVKLWLLRRFSVYFVSNNFTTTIQGQLRTPVKDDLKVLYLRFLLDDENINQPLIVFGVIFDVINKGRHKDFEKFEKFMTHMEYNEQKIFMDLKELQYEDAYIEISGKFLKKNLFDINDSKTIKDKIIDPMLDLYHNIK